MESEEIFSRTALDRQEEAGGQVSDRLFRLVLEHIRSGALPPGTRLPSVRNMAKRFGISPDTVVRAYQRLVHAADVEALRGSGYYVRADDPSSLQLAPAAIMKASAANGWETLLRMDRPIDRMPGTGLIQAPNETSDRARNALRSALRTRPNLNPGYGDPQGYLPLRRQLQRKLASEGISCEPASIITATGATGIMNIVVRGLVRPGDVAVVEDPGPFLHQILLLSQGAEIVTVPRKREGPYIEVLRKLCEAHRPRILFCSSMGHNPTGSAITAANAHQMLLLADEFNIVIVDDASYADLRPADAHTIWTPLAMLGGLRRVVHIGSFSRVMTPSLGVGYLAAGGVQLNRFRLFREIHGLGLNLIPERAMYQLLEDGQFERRQRSLSKHIAVERRRVISQLCEAGYRVDIPGTGPFVWLSLGTSERADMIHHRMAEQDFLAAPARIFTSSPDYSAFTRLNVTTTSPAALDILAGGSSDGLL
ncbi:PLP-dependent aminotransferase family protein [Sphingobium sp. H39-3-25]|uniref:aminotransferase-like domain-containing protein n=1 Tax=Sphingobium arseniciresistens TaxID=3030834 RepID=UPI0023B9E929|nr:PLP-dependent aminotransferase family protein [Sphingobium arseniciresistens]